MIPAGFVVKPIVIPRLLNLKESNAIIEAAIGAGMAKAPLAGAWEGGRVGDVSILSIDAPQLPWLHDRVTVAIQEVNRDFCFDVSNLSEVVQIARYDAGGCFDWHQDCDPDELPTKKLTMIIQLSKRSSYSCGEFEVFPYGALPFSGAQGAARVFPSYMFHRASKVTSGERWSLATFAHGPCFR
jgi:PKHD-type hydroxylase